MSWNLIFSLLFMYAELVYTKSEYHNINRLIKIIQRRNSRDIILGRPQYPEDLPRAERIIPGHTLIRPSMTMLASAVKFPHKDVDGHLVYGNLDNVGITYDKKQERILNTDFRKANNLMTVLKSLTKSSNVGSKRVKEPIVTSEEENNANEILDDIDDVHDNHPCCKHRLSLHEQNNTTSTKEIYSHDITTVNYRKSSKHKFRDRAKQYSSSTSDDSDDPADYEKNPGNPFTVHKNRYKQNWLWNHFMDGDHTNINPFAPELTVHGPSGADIFLSRKWWYFNQDDYIPFR